MHVIRKTVYSIKKFTEMINEGKVEVSISESVGTISFFHPKSNSLPGKILREIASQIQKLSADKSVKVILLKSEGEKAFCAGASFDELLQIKDFETGKKFFTGFALVINAIRKSEKFVVVRVHGKTVGGGVGLAAAGDYTLATKESSAKLSELALGIGPFVVGPAVERKMGKAAFCEMSIDYDWRSADWAKKNGLYNQIYSGVEELDEAVNAILHKLKNGSPEAMKELKKIAWEGTEDWDTLLEARAEISGKLVLSDFTKNYINSFKKK
ncbi:MAG: enoyl-CoA hydratase/isomerase family protein [Melioribacteraceae bacterium]|nr:enoyl-CoA hydratase/isomerase family protein [Melioribacteraceae bacterium]MCF8431273.1 enoyl-CoA hydratase/isomerase family protein [Melioribacteraceae bacterium]